MTDIAPELLEKIQNLFAEDVKSIREAMKSGQMSYEEAYACAFEVGSDLSRIFGENINAEILPDGRMYYNIANKVVLPMLKEEHDIVSQAAVLAQQNANRAAGIGIKPLAADFDADRAQGIIDRVSSQPFDEVKWLLDEPVKSFSKNVVDQTLEKNVEFQGKSGLHPKIVRRASAGACKWCQAVAGTYSYPDVPKDVYRRHANCDCVVEYIDGGKIQDVWSKKISARSRVEEIQERIANNEPDFYTGANGKTIGKEYRKWIGKNQMQLLLQRTKSEEVHNYIRSDYRKTSFIGDGSTAAIREFEIATGLNCGRNGNSHAQKVEDLSRQINKLLLKDLLESDKIFLQEMLNRLQGLM